MFHIGLFLLFGVCHSAAVEGKMYADPSQLSKNQYDFVIVGAGTAGCVLANRLTEIEAYNVLVVEAGVSNLYDPVDEVPFLGSTLSPNTALTWNYTTTPQIGLNNRSLPYPRGRVLGGSSTINFEVWTRGSVDDYNRYANVTGDEGWSWNEMLPYMKKSEDLVSPTDHHNTSGEVNPLVHGTHGPIDISLAGSPTPLDQRVINTTRQFPLQFPYNIDMNSGYPLGVGWAQSSVNTSGRRSSSAIGYLLPALSRPNLDVLILTQVTKLITSNTSSSAPAFKRVEMAHNTFSERFIVSAAKEVILSAGSIGTPQLLQLSGIGDPTTLKNVNITALVNLSDVGQNLVDHPLLGNHWLVNSNATWDAYDRNATLAADLLAQWNYTGTGPFSDAGTNQIAWTRLVNETEIFQHVSDPSAGPASPHMEIVPANGFVSFVLPEPDTGNYMTWVTNVVSPASRGSVTLTSNDPFDNPAIDPGFLTESIDMTMMIQAIKYARSFLGASAWNDYIISATDGLVTDITDAELEAYVRNYTATVFHPVGTAHMSATLSESGVLTSDLLVKGTTGLRVVDASVLPFIPAAHPQACIYAIAERAADLIKAAWD